MPAEQRGQVIGVGKEPTVKGRSFKSQRKAAAFVRWHEPDDARVSRPESVSGSGRNSPGRLGRLHGRVRLTNHDRWFLVQLYRWFPAILPVLTIIRPETLVRWHRAGFRRYWRWKTNSRGGRPQIQIELRALLRQMSRENPLWGAPRIHGELLKLGFQVAQSSVAKYMARRRGPPSQGWPTFLRNCAPDIAAMDLFVVPTIGFKLLYAFG